MKSVTHMTMDAIATEYTSRVNIVVNRVFKGERAVKNQVRTFTTMDNLDKRLDVIALACEWLPF